MSESNETLKTVKYQVTKTIRFKLEPVSYSNLQTLTENINEIDKEILIKNGNALIDGANQIKKNLINFIFVDEDTEKNFKSSIEINHRWLSTYAKDYFYVWSGRSNNQSHYQLKKVNFFKEIIKNWLNTWDTDIEMLSKIFKKYNEILHQRDPRSEIALLIKKINMRECFPFINDFFKSVKDKKGNTDVLIKKSSEFFDLLNNFSRNILPFQSSGFTIAKGSLNYYTVSKNEKNLEEEYDIVCKKINSEYANINKLQKYMLKKNYKALENKSIIFLYNAVKLDKAEQKRLFSEYVSQNIDIADIKKEDNNSYLPLFKDISEDDFKKYKDFSQTIKKNADEKNKLTNTNSDSEKLRQQRLTNKIQELKKKRGKLFQYNFQNYKSYCGEFKKIAMQYGKLKARKKSIEKDKIEAKLLQYWAIMILSKNEQYIVFIPKQKSKDAKKYLESLNKNGSGKYTIHHFDSLSLQALKKLCFNAVEIERGKNLRKNSFYEGIKKEFENFQNKQNDKEKKYFDVKGNFYVEGEFSFKINNKAESPVDEARLINFYKDVLRSNYAQRVLQLPNNLENDVLKKSHVTIDEFREDLETCCYTVNIKIDGNPFDTLQNNYNAEIFKLSSIDLRSKSKNTKSIDQMKKHTQLWLHFWQDKNKPEYYTRINPEFALTWRAPKRSRVEKYGKQSDLYDEKKHNRYLHDQYTLITTMSKNAGSLSAGLAFKDLSKVKDNIEKFNNNFSLPNYKFAIGIDRGNAELASLCILENKNSDGKHLPRKFKVYKLKDLQYCGSYISKSGKIKEGKAIQNISYFIEKNELFEEQETAAIDLTTAKLIKGKIVLNGDAVTYLKLKEETAKHRILELSAASVIDNNHSEVTFDKDLQAFTIKTNRSYKPVENIYFYRQEFEKLQSKSEIEKMLKEYVSHLLKNDNDSELLKLNRVNHLRDAISANMIGIISFLHEKISGSFVALENLTRGTIDSHVKQSYENISRRFEWSLYKKFQTKCLVPPELKETIFLREKKDAIDQFGIIKFVDEADTSNECPNCQSINKKNSHDKFRKHKYVCKKCGFDTENSRKGFDFLDSPDKVAAYNIAKRGFETFKSKHPKE